MLNLRQNCQNISLLGENIDRGYAGFTIRAIGLTRYDGDRDG